MSRVLVRGGQPAPDNADWLTTRADQLTSMASVAAYKNYMATEMTMELPDDLFSSLGAGPQQYRVAAALSGLLYGLTMEE